MLQDHVFSPGEHVLSRGGIPQAGYTLRGDAVYDRTRIFAAPWRLKEWDFYQIADDSLCLQLVIGHVSYAGNCNIALFDHANGVRLFERGVTIPLPFRSMHMPQSAHEDSLLRFSHGGAELLFETKSDQRHLSARCEGFSADVRLLPAVPESITVCTPFLKKHEFYYNEKINLLRAEVSVSLDGTNYAFDPDRTFSLLDWGRGIWPFSHEWYWSSVSTLLDGKPFGFNLGCGFGDAEKARGTENIVYHNGNAIKLGRVLITHEADVMQPWRFEEENGRFSAVLTPRYDRDTVTKLLFVNNRCHQMFGLFSGSLRTDSGEQIAFSNVAGFAEHAVNHW
ncbi:MAG TPA: DUF2804 domain-containing protein [Clostridia bacterium]|nr:DUF2804 domain-containing protein [Clostridia bacterium]